jgi:hypothetical protein
MRKSSEKSSGNKDSRKATPNSKVLIREEPPMGRRRFGLATSQRPRLCRGIIYEIKE